MTPKPPRRSQAQRRIESRSRILSAAMQLVIENGFDRFSLQDIGRKADCSHELVNFYFGNKDGLLNALAMHIIGTISHELQSLDSEPSGFESFARQIRYVAAIPDRSGAAFTAYIRIAGEAAFREPVARLYRDRRIQTVDIFRKSILAGQESGDIRRTVSADHVAEVAYDFVRGNVDRQLLDRNADAHVEFDFIVDSFIEILRGQLVVHRN
ncbi:TetR/AcrR family transcriptional regulator [Sphingobium sp. CR2-8]|uniref:TetR/AcrR family transcriptional regulator n=1 Tax=Sphingobium sp. CR2-8 TaxID=1306534 RepID=UPI002DB6E72D|nr:TetR/AcrR family transcriptional regulator [Sphingobium sp. CR2-8]MEC3909520.1 TetR/AcrR family transcriptional regulator [Sphingobium sp. CR2-8]